MGIRLSVLIPTYDYVEGLDRILSSFLTDPSDEIEILISDDSHDEHVNHLVADFSSQYLGKLDYRRNCPGLGAVVNWNSLLAQASGDYILLLHHDEYPLGDRFVWKVLEFLRKNSEVDVLVMNCILCTSTDLIGRPHLPKIIRSLVVKYYPSYLFRRNVIGPTSCLIVRRELYPRFDECLRWLVDVEAYFRLRLKTERWRFCNSLKIGSALGRNESITSSIKDELRQIDASERSYLRRKYPVAEVWLEPSAHWIINLLEFALWGWMRIVTRMCFIFTHLYSLSKLYLQRKIK